MKNGLITLAGAIALAGVIATHYSTSLLAQVRAALVSDVDNPARNPVRISRQFIVNDEVRCFQPGYTVPAGKRLIIDDVSAATVVGTTSAAAFVMELIVSPDSGVCDSLSRESIASIPFRTPILVGGARYYTSAHESTQLAVNPSESVAIELRSNGPYPTISARYSLYLSGHLVTLP